MMKRALLLLALLQLPACAFTDASLDLKYDASKASKGLLSSVPSKKLAVEPTTDVRANKDVIGYKRNGFGMKTADITTKTPVAQIVQDALTKTLETNGHVNDANAAYVVNSNVKKFWFDFSAGLVSVEFRGDVEVEVSITNRATKATIFTETFLGHYTQENAIGGLEGTWTEVMDAAVADMAKKISLSPTLKTALEQVPN